MFNCLIVVYTCSMATVYLPLGYPQMSGEVFETLIYQGNVVRLYQVPNDPRTDSQTFERKLFSDFVKMRSTLGPWARGALKSALGSKWATVLYQLAKIDHEGMWSQTLDSWDEIQANEQEGWREMAPYQATFNDPGQVFYRLAQFVYYVLTDFLGWAWGAAEWASNEEENAVGWWVGDIEGLATQQKLDDRSDYLHYVGSWIQAGIQWTYLQTSSATLNENQERAWLTFFGRSFDFIFTKNVLQGTVQVWVDGSKRADVDQLYNGNPALYQQSVAVDCNYRGMHYVEFKNPGTGYWNIDAVDLN